MKLQKLNIDDLKIGMLVQMDFPNGKTTKATLKEINTYSTMGLDKDYIFDALPGWEVFSPHKLWKNNPETERYFPLPDKFVNMTEVYLLEDNLVVDEETDEEIEARLRKRLAELKAELAELEAEEVNE